MRSGAFFAFYRAVMIIAATFRLTGDDLDLDKAIVFWNDCLIDAARRGWSTVDSHAEFIEDRTEP